MAVVNDAGLVGKITTPLLPDRAYVMLVSDLQYSTQVKVVPGHRRRRRRPAASTTVAERVAADVGRRPTTTPPRVLDVARRRRRRPCQPTTRPRPSTSTSTSTTTTLDLDSPRETGLLRGQGDGELPQVDLLADTPVIGRIRRGDTVLTAGGTRRAWPRRTSRSAGSSTRQPVDRRGPAARGRAATPTSTELNFVRVVLYKPASEVEPRPTARRRATDAGLAGPGPVAPARPGRADRRRPAAHAVRRPAAGRRVDAGRARPRRRRRRRRRSAEGRPGRLRARADVRPRRRHAAGIVLDHDGSRRLRRRLRHVDHDRPAVVARRHLRRARGGDRRGGGAGGPHVHRRGGRVQPAPG